MAPGGRTAWVELSTRRPRVLIVEDDISIQGLLRDVLALEGYDVAGAENGKDALRVLREWPPDLIVLDLMMPVMDGWTFRREQRKLPDSKDVPVIVVSAAHGRIAELGAEAFVPKPFDVGEFLTHVHRVVRPPD